MTGYRFINSLLLDNNETAELIYDIGIKEPSFKDQIYNVILPLYKNGNTDIDIDAHFKIFFDYYCECTTDEGADLIALIKGCEFLRVFDKNASFRAKASRVYFPTEDLKKYFAPKSDARFINYDYYFRLVGTTREKSLLSFFQKLGIKDEPAVIIEEIEDTTREGLPRPNSSRKKTYIENNVDGFSELINDIEKDKNAEESILLWRMLIKLLDNSRIGGTKASLNILFQGVCNYFFKRNKEEVYDSRNLYELKHKKWLLTKNGTFAAPSDISISELSDVYNIESETAMSIIEALAFMPEIDSNDEDNLTDEQREQIDFAKKIQDLGISKDEIMLILAEYQKKKEAKTNSSQRQINTGTEKIRDKAERTHTDDDYSSAKADSFNDENDLFDENELYDEVSKEEHEDTSNHLQSGIGKDRTDTQRNIRKEVVKDIFKRTRKPKVSPVYEEEVDSDEWIPSTVDYSKKIERAKEKSAVEIDKITHLEDLQEKAIKATIYSYEWFKTLLEMECLNSNELNQNSREVSISFAKVEREPGTKRTLVLMHPNRFIPQFMEDLTDIPMILHMGDTTKTLAIEVANIKSYTLRVKLKSDVAIEGIEFDKVDSVTIEAKSPAFLLEELRKQFEELGYEDSFNMKENLCENIEFVFGPPGTGKTTYLAKNVLIPLMKGYENYKVLVLTPTNKSADVLVHRIMEIYREDREYEDWLIRFGATGEESIEQSPVFREKTYDIRNTSRNVTVTTIARFPYDFFMPADKRLFLQSLNWDYIIIDEASMIPLINIIYPLYKKTPKKFIIAGDPFQIEPITSLNLWKDMNIYTLVGLNSFAEPKTEPYQYDVRLLTTQYRSIPDVGNIFSRFTYGGILKHNRDKSDQRIIRLGADKTMDTLNILKYPVSKYESIYRSKKLQHSSSYQIYSALFIYEYICNLSKVITKYNQGEEYKIGIIAPYRAQADLIEKLVASEKFPKSFDVQVDTIHGFQGDECDIIFAVFNSPPYISASPDMFLNKRNIINVSISRARDYLFIVMPDDKTENVENLRLVKRVESIIKNSDSWNEELTPDIEEEIFGDSQYLMNNTFSTGHQSVNVYGLPEKYYEVRTEDNAVDIQIHKDT